MTKTSKASSKTSKALSLESKREMAKIGMGVSLALTTLSALNMQNQSANKLHVISGIALVGFSLWHYSLYPKEKAKKSI